MRAYLVWTFERHENHHSYNLDQVLGSYDNAVRRMRHLLDIGWPTARIEVWEMETGMRVSEETFKRE